MSAKVFLAGLFGLLAFLVGGCVNGFSELRFESILLLSGSILLTLIGMSHWLYLAYHTLNRDLITIVRFCHLMIVNTIAKMRDLTVAEKFIETAEKYSDKAMVIFCQEDFDQVLTYREAREKVAQIAHYFLAQGYKKGDVVAIVLENRVDYCCYWLGLTRIGVVPALVNSNLRSDSLIHTITVAKSKAILFSADLSSAVIDVMPQLPVTTKLYCVDPELTTSMGGVIFLPKQLEGQRKDDIIGRHAGYKDDLFYIYTSGTTGLPKPAVIKNQRFMFATYALFSMNWMTDKEVLYSPLPFYHTAAGNLTLGNTLLEGLTMVTRKRFSVRAYWSDCRRNGVTGGQYIGEIARYLYQAPPGPLDRLHGLKFMYGNGMRPDIWQQFVQRFGIGHFCEFYGSTEGNCSTGNIFGKPGSVGYISVLFPFLLPMGLIRVDEETREPARDPATGLCVPCQPGEPGELVGRIQRGHPVRDFHGYADSQATKKKVLSDVWKKGDLCFRSGDILVMDEFGWLSFKDRAGDTFRWKGENVSTAEVEATCSRVLELQDCVVYGVEVAGCEGRAGMLCVPDPNHNIDLGKLYSGLAEKLPSYARPIFLRLVDRIELTATFKLKKRDLQREGYDPSSVKDPLYIADPASKSYKLLTSELHQEIIDGRIKL